MGFSSLTATALKSAANFNAQSWARGRLPLRLGRVQPRALRGVPGVEFLNPELKRGQIGLNQFALSYASRTGNVERG